MSDFYKAVIDLHKAYGKLKKIFAVDLDKTADDDFYKAFRNLHEACNDYDDVIDHIGMEELEKDFYGIMAEYLIKTITDFENICYKINNPDSKLNMEKEMDEYYKAKNNLLKARKRVRALYCP